MSGRIDWEPCPAAVVAMGENNVTGHSLHYYLNGPATLATVAAGVLLNVASMLVFCRPRLVGERQPAIYHHFTALALCDAVMLLGAAAMYAGPTMYYGQLTLRMGSYTRYVPAIFYLCQLCMFLDVWLVVLIGVARYVSLNCHSSRVPQAAVSLRSRKALTILTLVATVYKLPTLFEVDVYQCYESTVNLAEQRGNVEQVWWIEESDLRRSQLYQTVYHVLCGLATHTLLPFVVLLVLSCKLAVAMRRAAVCKAVMAAAMLRNNLQQANQERGTGNMLLAIIVKLLLSRIGITFIFFAEIFISYNPLYYGRWFPLVVDLSNFIQVFNSASNFVVYFAFSEYFRRSTLRLATCTLCVAESSQAEQLGATVTRLAQLAGSVPASAVQRAVIRKLTKPTKSRRDAVCRALTDMDETLGVSGTWAEPTVPEAVGMLGRSAAHIVAVATADGGGGGGHRPDSNNVAAANGAEAKRDETELAQSPPPAGSDKGNEDDEYSNSIKFV